MTATVPDSMRPGARVPRSGNALTRGFGRLVLRLLGWRLEGAIPDAPKMVLIGAPHTSNFDGVIGIAALVALGLKASTMIKASAFEGPLGPVLRAFGAIPVNRKSPRGVVEQTADAFAAKSQLLMLIAPEGTRHAAPEFKRGFWHIASQAGVPILPAAADYQRRVITFGPPLMPSGAFAEDLEVLLRFYAAHGVPRHAARLSRPMCEHQGRTWQPQERKLS